MISVITVNHNTSALLKECHSSIVSTIQGDPFEFIAIDSGSRKEDADDLRSFEGEGVRIIMNKENVGYANGVNQGIRSAKGDVILITNPDVLYKPGSIKAMAQALSQLPSCGAVGPRTWWNRQMTFLLPVSEMVVPHRIFLGELARSSRTMFSLILKHWMRKTLGYWLSKKPQEQEMLSGACIMTTRQALDRVGGFDDSFPLYFEDTDWFLRVRKAGYRLYVVPDAQIVHYYNQSAKQDSEASSRKYGESSEKYFRKHFGKGRLSFFRYLSRAVHSRNVIRDIYEDMGALTAPPSFRFGGVSKKLFLLSPVDLMIPAAGSFFEGNSFEIPEDLWGLLGEGRYFATTFGVNDYNQCGAWSWEKKGR